MIKANFALGLALGAIVTFGTAALIDGNLSAEAATLWAGALALLGALIAGWLAWEGVQRQIRAQAGLLDRQRYARLEAERAALPAALRQIARHCDTRIAVLASANVEEGQQADAGVLETLKACIEHSEEDAKRILVDLLHIYGATVLGDYYLTTGAHPRRNSLRSLIAYGEQMHQHAEQRLQLISFWIALKARVASLEDYAVGMTGSCDEADVPDIFVRELANLSSDGFPMEALPGYASILATIVPDGVHFLCRRNWREVWCARNSGRNPEPACP